MRIEDTDTARSDADLIKPIMEALQWLGIDWDETPLYQSQRLELYKKYADTLLETGHAYRCFCTPEELEKRRAVAMAEKRNPHYDRMCLNRSQTEIDNLLKGKAPFAIRLKIPEGETSYQDGILGLIAKQNSEIEDLVLCRADGRATYNLAVVVDDHEMGITDVIRGNDHISNTFKQIHIYESLGFSIPRFAHLPLILRPDKKKVSKRLGDKDVAAYNQEGILPEAMFNFLCLLGWSPKDDREVFTRQELIEIFRLDFVNKSNPVFNEEKLLAINFEHLRRLPDHKIAEMVAPLLVEAGFATKYWLETRWDYLIKVVGLLKERAHRVTDFVALGGYFFYSDFNYDAEGAAKRFTPQASERLKVLLERFAAIDVFTKDKIEGTLAGLASEEGIKSAELIHPLRLAVSGLTGGPGLYDILETIGREQVMTRMQRAIDYIQNMRA